MSRSRYVAGLRAVEQLLATPGAEIARMFVEYKTANPRVEAVTQTARSQGIDIQSANRARLRQISGEARHQGVVAEIRSSTELDEAALRTLVEKRLTEEGGSPLLLLVLDGVQDPHNLGACMRTADAVGADAVVVPRHGAAGIGPTVSKVAAGAAESLPFASIANIGKTLTWLGEYGVHRVATSDGSESDIYAADLASPVAIVMGGEHGGVSQRVAERCDATVRLPMHGTVESLNVSVATGVVLYEALRQRRSEAP